MRRALFAAARAIRSTVIGPDASDDDETERSESSQQHVEFTNNINSKPSSAPARHALHKSVSIRPTMTHMQPSAAEDTLNNTSGRSTKQVPLAIRRIKPLPKQLPPRQTPSSYNLRPRSRITTSARTDIVATSRPAFVSVREVQNASTATLQLLCHQFGLPNSGSKEQLRARVMSKMAEKTVDEFSPCPTDEKLLVSPPRPDPDCDRNDPNRITTSTTKNKLTSNRDPIVRGRGDIHGKSDSPDADFNNLPLSHTLPSTSQPARSWVTDRSTMDNCSIQKMPPTPNLAIPRPSGLPPSVPQSPCYNSQTGINSSSSLNPNAIFKDWLRTNRSLSSKEYEACMRALKGSVKDASNSRPPPMKVRTSSGKISLPRKHPRAPAAPVTSAAQASSSLPPADLEREVVHSGNSLAHKESRNVIFHTDSNEPAPVDHPMGERIFATAKSTQNRSSVNNVDRARSGQIGVETTPIIAMAAASANGGIDNNTRNKSKMDEDSKIPDEIPLKTMPLPEPGQTGLGDEPLKEGQWVTPQQMLRTFNNWTAPKNKPVRYDPKYWWPKWNRPPALVREAIIKQKRRMKETEEQNRRMLYTHCTAEMKKMDTREDMRIFERTRDANARASVYERQPVASASGGELVDLREAIKQKKTIYELRRIRMGEPPKSPPLGPQAQRILEGLDMLRRDNRRRERERELKRSNSPIPLPRFMKRMRTTGEFDGTNQSEVNRKGPYSLRPIKPNPAGPTESPSVQGEDSSKRADDVSNGSLSNKAEQSDSFARNEKVEQNGSNNLTERAPISGIPAVPAANPAKTSAFEPIGASARSSSFGNVPKFSSGRFDGGSETTGPLNNMFSGDMKLKGSSSKTLGFQDIASSRNGNTMTAQELTDSAIKAASGWWPGLSKAPDSSIDQSEAKKPQSFPLGSKGTNPRASSEGELADESSTFGFQISTGKKGIFDTLNYAPRKDPSTSFESYRYTEKYRPPVERYRSPGFFLTQTFGTQKDELDAVKGANMGEVEPQGSSGKQPSISFPSSSLAFSNSDTQPSARFGTNLPEEKSVVSVAMKIQETQANLTGDIKSFGSNDHSKQESGEEEKTEVVNEHAAPETGVTDATAPTTTVDFSGPKPTVDFTTPLALEENPSDGAPLAGTVDSSAIDTSSLTVGEQSLVAENPLELDSVATPVNSISKTDIQQAATAGPTYFVSKNPVETNPPGAPAPIENSFASKKTESLFLSKDTAESPFTSKNAQSSQKRPGDAMATSPQAEQPRSVFGSEKQVSVAAGGPFGAFQSSKTEITAPFGVSEIQPAKAFSLSASVDPVPPPTGGPFGSAKFSTSFKSIGPVSSFVFGSNAPPSAPKTSSVGEVGSFPSGKLSSNHNISQNTLFGNPSSSANPLFASAPSVFGGNSQSQTFPSFSKGSFGSSTPSNPPNAFQFGNSNVTSFGQNNTPQPSFPFASNQTATTSAPAFGAPSNPMNPPMFGSSQGLGNAFAPAPFNPQAGPNQAFNSSSNNPFPPSNIFGANTGTPGPDQRVNNASGSGQGGNLFSQSTKRPPGAFNMGSTSGQPRRKVRAKRLLR